MTKRVSGLNPWTNGEILYAADLNDTAMNPPLIHVKTGSAWGPFVANDGNLLTCGSFNITPVVSGVILGLNATATVKGIFQPAASYYEGDVRVKVSGTNTGVWTLARVYANNFSPESSLSSYTSVIARTDLPFGSSYSELEVGGQGFGYIPILDTTVNVALQLSATVGVSGAATLTSGTWSVIYANNCTFD